MCVAELSPLRREAYVPDRLDQQLDDNARVWVSNARLNEFLPAARRANVSPIFEWYAPDFERSGSIEKFLARYAPASAFLRERVVKIEYQTYDWGPNVKFGRNGFPVAVPVGLFPQQVLNKSQSADEHLDQLSLFANLSHFRPYRSGASHDSAPEQI